MLHDTVAALDDFYQNADEWHERVQSGEFGEDAWTTELIREDFRMTDDAARTFGDTLNVFLSHGNRKQEGDTTIVGLNVDSVDLEPDTPTASGQACIDQSETSLVTFEGEPLEESADIAGQTWDITWEETIANPKESEPRWYITDIAVTPETPC